MYFKKIFLDLFHDANAAKTMRLKSPQKKHTEQMFPLSSVRPAKYVTTLLFAVLE